MWSEHKSERSKEMIRERKASAKATSKGEKATQTEAERRVYTNEK